MGECGMRQEENSLWTDTKRRGGGGIEGGTGEGIPGDNEPSPRFNEREDG